MPTALSTIDIAKEQRTTYRPLLVYTITFTDGAVLRLSSAPLSTAEGGYQYGGNDYLGRIAEQDIESIQELADGGIDVAPRVRLNLHDADQYLWTTYEVAKGFRGATVEARFIFWQADTSTFSSDSSVRFVGICDAADSDERMLTVSAVSKLALQRSRLPVLSIQRSCPHLFPTTSAQRTDGASNSDSPYYACGYSPDVGGGVGNYQSGVTPFASCDYSRDACIARLGDASRVPPYNSTTNRPPIQADTSSRETGRFGGVTYDPPAATRGRSYLTGKWIDVDNSPVEGRYGDTVPMVLGTGWVDCPVLWRYEDGNYTRGEALVCSGSVDYILDVVVNDVQLMAATDMDGASYTAANRDRRYHVINRGDRDGSVNLDSPVAGAGDPYGSLCVVYFVLPAGQAGSTPRVRALVRGPRVRVYTDATTFTAEYSNNPAWLLLDALTTWGKFRISDIDVASFVSAAAHCSASINYTDNTGATSSHARFGANLIVRQRRPLAEVVRDLRQAGGGILLQPGRDGKLWCLAPSTLATQQPAPVAGSNYATPIASTAVTGGAADGYAAYRFDRSTILLDESTGGARLRVSQRPIAESANRLSVQFADEDLIYGASAVAVVDTDDVARAGEEVAQSVQLDAVPNHDQAQRVARRMLAQMLRGNARGDTGGTVRVDLETSFRGVRLEIGQLVVIHYPKKGLSEQLFRVIRLQPSADFETLRVTADWHSDSWYLDTYGQQADPGFAGSRAESGERDPFAWRPAIETPVSGDPIYGTDQQSFSLRQVYQTLGDGSRGLALDVRGYAPVTAPAAIAPPLVREQGAGATSGGSLSGGRTYYVALAALDASSKQSALSNVVGVPVAATSTGTVTVWIDAWADGATGYVLYAGTEPDALSRQSSSGTTPTSVVLTALVRAAKGPPDVAASRIGVDVALVAHAGVWGAEVTAVAAGTITVSGAGWTVNEWAGRDVSVLAAPEGTELVPLRNYRVVSNTASVLTVTPDPNGDLAVGSVIVMRSTPTVSGGGLVLTDAKWVNSLAPSGLTAADELGRAVRIVAGAGAGQVRRIVAATSTSLTVDRSWEVTPDTTSRYIVQESAADAQGAAVSEVLPNTSDSTEMRIRALVPNLANQAVVVVPYVESADGRQSADSQAVVREAYLRGSAALSSGVGPWHAVTYSATINLSLADGARQRVTLTGDVTFGAPAGGSDGAELTLLILQDGTGNRAVTWNAAWGWAAGMGEVDGAAGKATLITWIWDGSTPRVVAKMMGAQ